MEDKIEVGEYENIELTTLLRTFKKEGIENFVVVRKNKLENLIKAYKELEKNEKFKNKLLVCGLNNKEDKILNKANEIIENHREVDRMMVLEVVEMAEYIVKLHKENEELKNTLLVEGLNNE